MQAARGIRALHTAMAAAVITFPMASDAQSQPCAASLSRAALGTQLAASVATDASSSLRTVGSYHIARSAVRSVCDDRDSRVHAAWRGAALAMSVGVATEVVDRARSGSSAGDLRFDALGAGYAVAQSYLPVLDKVTPSFSVAPRAIFRRRGPRGALMDYGQSSLWLAANVHDLLPASAAKAWPSPVRLSVGRRAFGGPVPSEYMVGLDLDAERLPGQHPLWMQAKHLLHGLRLPGPALVMGPRGARMVGLYW